MFQIPIIPTFQYLRRRVGAWLGSWWRIVLFGVVVVTLALTPSTYRRQNAGAGDSAENDDNDGNGSSRSTSRRNIRSAIADQIVQATTSNLLWFTMLSSLISIVLIRIVVVTALSYGLSRFAIEMVVRVLVLELIPLAAAMFVALRYTLPESAELQHLRGLDQSDNPDYKEADVVPQEFLPRVLAGIFSVWMLGAVSCIMTLLLAYVNIYGTTPWALSGYTRVVGQVFNPSVTMILMLKIFFFSLAVSIVPMATAYYGRHTAVRSERVRLANGLDGMVRLFGVVLMIELVSLMGNYY